MRADEAIVGQVVNWRGQRAEIVAAWRRQEDAPMKLCPVGLDLEIEQPGPDGVPEKVRFRWTWPDLTAQEREDLFALLRGTPQQRRQAAQTIADTLAAQLAAIQLTLWTGG